MKIFQGKWSKIIFCTRNKLFFDVYFMTLGLKLAILKIQRTTVSFMTQCNIEAAHEESYATQGADKGLKLKLGTLSVWEI